MSIFPATDLIVDVAKAADPKRQQVALRRLEAAANAPEVSFASLTQESGAKGSALGSSTWRAAGVGLRAAYPPPPAGTTVVSAASNPAAEAAKKFEALVLQTFFEALLPKDDESFGSGAAGGVWRSMMAEQLSEKLAASGVVGLKKMLETKIAPGGSSPPSSTSTKTT
jgi:peptidoglycan hydrolase FlgJ